MNHKPLISIVIPTRDRHETLEYTIQTILQQKFDNYEIIVSDNNSSKETRNIINNINLEKIRYVRSNIDLTLCESWEQAVSNAQGEYVMGISDNDGLIDGSLEFIAKLLEVNNNPLVINFVKNNYHWPELEITGNMMILHSIKEFEQLEQIDGISLIQEVLTNTKQFYRLPMIYNSIVNRKLIEQMISFNGKIFNALSSPDVYSGFMIAYFSKFYLKLNIPVTIAGNSAKSIGVNCLRNHKSEVLNREIIARKKSSIKLHHLIPQGNIMSHTSSIYDAYFQFQDLTQTNNFIIDMKLVYKQIVDDLLVFTQEDLDKSLEQIYLACSKNKTILDFIYSYINIHPIKIKKVDLVRPKNNLYTNSLILDGKKFNCDNILDVSKFMANFYDYSSPEIYLDKLKNDFSNLHLNCKIAIWGNGEYGRMLQKELIQKRTDIDITFFIDSFSESILTEPITITPNNIPMDLDYIVIASSFIDEISKIIFNLQLPKNITIIKFII